MHELVYYSIFAIILYFVLSSVFETFSAEQENFDPSLVPVSSIVTLAKVAQKLVNGNGTLTNPGNLQIGASASAPGNLTVTGNSTVNGNILFGGVGTDGFMWNKETSNYACLRAPGSPANGGGNRLCFSKDHGVVNFNSDGSLGLAGALNVPGNINLNSTTNAITVGDNNQRIQFHGGDGLKINTYNGGTLAVNKGDPAKYAEGTNIFTWNEGGAAVNGVLSSSGNINARTDGFNTRIGGIWTAPGIYAEGTKNLEIGAGSGNVYVGSADNSAKHNLIVNGTSGFGGSDELGFKWSNENRGGWACLRSGNDTVSAGGHRLCFHRDHGLAHFFPKGHLDITGKITVPRVETTTLIATGGSTISGVTWMNDVRANDFTATGNLNAGGSLCLGGVCINADHLRMLNGQKRFQLGADSGHCVDAGDGRSQGCNDNQWKRFRFIPV
jgi:hypothetical protein